MLFCTLNRGDIPLSADTECLESQAWGGGQEPAIEVLAKLCSDVVATT
jgi:hypothetical protein